MNDPTGWMWAEACSQLERAERLRNRFFEPGISRQSPSAWEPPVDIYETDREVRIVAALPGVAPEDLEIHLEENLLVVGGRRRFPAVLPGAIIQRIEIPHGYFERRIQFSGTMLRVGDKEFANGCLLLRLVRQA